MFLMPIMERTGKTFIPSFAQICQMNLKSTSSGIIAVYSVESQPTFWGSTSPPSSGSKNKRFKKQHEDLIATRFTLLSCLAYSSTVKKKAIYYSETAVHFKRTIRRYISGDRTLHNHRCENPRPYKCFKWGHTDTHRQYGESISLLSIAKEVEIKQKFSKHLDW
jgi:hypothetical protein